MKQHSAEVESQPQHPDPADRHLSVADPARTVRGLADDIGRFGQDLEARYIAARDAWTQAMHVANSGRPADLASLAIAQQAYEQVAAEREHWLAGGSVAIPIQPARTRHDIEIAVGQELAWRKVHEHPRKRGLLARIRSRLTGR